MAKLNNKQLNEKYDQLIVEMQNFRVLMEEVEALDLNTLSEKADNIEEAHKNLFEPVRDHENEITQVPKAQWFDDKFDEINTKVKGLEKFESSINELQKRAEKLTQAVTEKATFDSFKTQAKKYRSFAKSHAIGGYICMVLIPTFIVMFSAFSEPDGIWEHIRNFFLISTGVGALATLFVTTQNTKTRYIKLAADYEYKATLSESLIGYRKLHQIAYDDVEYKELFKKLSDALTFNPSAHIIGVKQPNNKISKVVRDDDPEDD